MKDLDKLDVLLPQLIEQFPPMIAIMESMRTMMLTMPQHHGRDFRRRWTKSSQDATAMGQAFDAAKNDDSFYLPPEIFENPDFQRAMSSFLSPDGKAARFIISQRGDPATPEGISRIDQIRTAAEEALKATPLANAKIYIAGTASTFKDFRDGSKYDLLIAGVGALCLIFVIMLDHHAKFCGRTGYRGYGGTFVGRIVWAVGADLAVYSGHQIALDGASDVRDRPFGGRV